ncbi:MAG: septal ring lytic transglycosylase RlpA family protein [Actinomycetota bacterium]
MIQTLLAPPQHLLASQQLNACKASWYSYADGAHGRYWTAHKTLPMGTRIRITYGHKVITVGVHDRGPYVSGRCLDLDAWSFSKLAPLGTGVIAVRWKVV